MSIYVNIRKTINDKDEESLESTDSGCGCCSQGWEVSKEDALKEIDDAIEELHKMRAIIFAEKYDEL